MRSFVITIMDNEKSVQAAARCIESARKFDTDVEMYPATTPNNCDVATLAKTMGIPTAGFREKYSRFDNCLAAFLSHHALWGQCYISGEEHQIFEHDAVIINELPKTLNHNGCINLGKPSYGKYNDPLLLGKNPLTSKRYFPGAHAYRVNSKGAKQLLAQALIRAMPTDIFLHLDTFPWLEEYYPWPAEAMDSFTTIQKIEGCLAKHRYKDGYEIL
jgi:GR25 family glycosyltransferase involved in LPS biosynthesis